MICFRKSAVDQLMLPFEVLPYQFGKAGLPGRRVIVKVTSFLYFGRVSHHGRDHFNLEAVCELGIFDHGYAAYLNYIFPEGQKLGANQSLSQISDELIDGGTYDQAKRRVKLD